MARARRLDVAGEGAAQRPAVRPLRDGQRHLMARRSSAMDEGRNDPPDDGGALQSPGRIEVIVSHPTVEIRPPDLVRRCAITCRGLTAETVQSTSCRTLEYRFRAPMHLLVIYEDGARRDGETLVGGFRATLRRFAEKLTFVPAGYQYYEWHDLRALSRLTYFYLEPACLRWHSDTDIAGVSLVPRLFFEDEWLWHTGRELIDLVEHPESGNQLYFEALGVVLVYQLLRLHRGSNGQHHVRGGLGPRQLRIAIAYIEEHFAERIEIATLARLVRQSPFHFCRAFKQSVGMPPHRYQSKLRVERAKLLLLANPMMSVTDIGMTIGFGSSTSFATAFRKATGFTPTSFQRSFG